MVGFNCHRFPDLTTDLAKELTCGVCHHIYDNPVETHCKHTYCLQCLQEWITIDGQKSCPECRQSLITRKPTESAVNDKNVVLIGGDVVVAKNSAVAAVVAKLRIKCSFAAKGCGEVYALDAMPAHMENCIFKTCVECGECVGLMHVLIQVLDNESKAQERELQRLEAEIATKEALISILKRIQRKLEMKIKNKRKFL